MWGPALGLGLAWTSENVFVIVIRAMMRSRGWPKRVGMPRRLRRTLRAYKRANIDAGAGLFNKLTFRTNDPRDYDGAGSQPNLFDQYCSAPSSGGLYTAFQVRKFRYIIQPVKTADSDVFIGTFGTEDSTPSLSSMEQLMEEIRFRSKKVYGSTSEGYHYTQTLRSNTLTGAIVTGKHQNRPF